MGRVPFKRWNELSEEERNRVGWVVHALRVFYAGRLLGKAIEAPHSPLNEFVSDGIINCFYAFYCGTHRGVLPVLHSVGCGDLADPIDEVVQRRIGRQTVAQRVAHYRNKLLQHPSFDFSTVPRDFPFDSEQERAYNESLVELLRHTERLFIELRKRYPEPLA